MHLLIHTLTCTCRLSVILLLILLIFYCHSIAHQQTLHEQINLLICRSFKTIASLKRNKLFIHYSDMGVILSSKILSDGCVWYSFTFVELQQAVWSHLPTMKDNNQIRTSRAGTYSHAYAYSSYTCAYLGRPWPNLLFLLPILLFFFAQIFYIFCFLLYPFCF